MGIQWSENLMVGHPVLDVDHADIIQKINQFETLIDRKTDRKHLAQHYSNIVECLSDHFVRGERIILVAKYPDSEMHLSTHGDLFVKLSNMTILIEIDGHDTEAVILKSLHNWLFWHVITLDKSLSSFLHYSLS